MDIMSSKYWHQVNLSAMVPTLTKNVNVIQFWTKILLFSIQLGFYVNMFPKWAAPLYNFHMNYFYTLRHTVVRGIMYICK